MKSEVEYSGLSESEVLASRERYGENILTPPARTPMWKLFLEKFSDPIIRILLVALLLSVAVAVYHIATGEAGMSALFEPAGIASGKRRSSCQGHTRRTYVGDTQTGDCRGRHRYVECRR